MMKLSRIRRIGVLLATCLMALAVVFAVGCGQKAPDDDAGATQPAAQEQPAGQADDPGGGSGDSQAAQPDEGSGGSAKVDNPGGADSATSGSSTSGSSSSTQTAAIDENGSYTSKDEVALYIHTYGHLPGNFISKSKAKKAGWVAKQGNLDEVCPGKSIGGSEFYNDEGVLPDKSGRTWKECDINYHGGYRGSERIVFSNDGLIFYTDDHYQTFEQLY